jgi:hypothetical protein
VVSSVDRSTIGMWVDRVGVHGVDRGVGQDGDGVDEQRHRLGVLPTVCRTSTSGDATAATGRPLLAAMREVCRSRMLSGTVSH